MPPIRNKTTTSKAHGDSSIANGSKKVAGTSKDSDASSSVAVASKGIRKNNYNPSAPSYHPLNDACWVLGEDTPYYALAKTFEAIEAESKRNNIIQTMTNFLRSVILLHPDDVVKCLYLSLNKIAPSWEGIELGVGEKSAIKPVADATGVSEERVTKELKKSGDLGTVAEELRIAQKTLKKPQRLSVKKVFDTFHQISQVSSKNSKKPKEEKQRLVTSLLRDCDPAEIKYIVRALSGKMRMGLAEPSAIAALAHAAVLTPPNEFYNASHEQPLTKMGSKASEFKKAEGVLKKAYNECPHYEYLVGALLRGGFPEVEKSCHVTAGVPIKPMLASSSKGLDLLLAKLGDAEFVSEYKYDGERAQIHRDKKGDMRIFSRNQEDHTEKFAEVCVRFPTHLGPGVNSFILDAEIVAWDGDNKQILPFQILSTRKRKKEKADKPAKVQVSVYAFDLLFLNGKSMITSTLRQRQEVLRKSFLPNPGEFMFATSLISNDPDDVQNFMTEAIENSCEGLMVKALDIPYQISKRSNNWLKLKKDYLDNIGDSVDVVIVGAFMGKGKRAGEYGSYLCAVYDAGRGEFQTLCKVATGLSDEQLQKHTAFFKRHVIKLPPASYIYSRTQNPDVWFSPVQVWEIKGADLTLSSVSTAASGKVEADKGISLRFPRFLRVRTDKKPEDATTDKQIAQLYNDQFARKPKVNLKDEDDDDEDGSD